KWSSYYILVIQSISPLSRFRSSCSQVKFSRVTIVSMSRILSAPKTTKPRTTPFQAAHCVQYGLKIVERHPQKQDVTGVRCRFCLHFGREDKVVQQEPSRSKRQLTAKVKDWAPPFRPEYYDNHHKAQHSTRWQVYQSLSHDQKQSYFDDRIPYKDTIFNHFGQQNGHLVFNIDKYIVETIIGDMFFHPNEQESSIRLNSLKLFDPNDHDYTVTIKNPTQFHLVVGYLSGGLSFRQVQHVFDTTKKHTAMTRLGIVSDTTVANQARIVCAINLQRISEILNDSSVWAFSLANDSSTHYGRSYFDNRIRFHRDGVLYNIHALAIPMFERHTGENMFNLVSDFLGVICSQWRGKLLGVGTDGASSMTGHVRGVATRIEQAIEHKFYRVWCGLHQLDLVMKHAYVDIKDKKFNKILHSLTKYLRQQHKLIADMQSTCPNATTRWIAMGATCKWLLEKHIQVLEYIAVDQ